MKDLTRTDRPLGEVQKGVLRALLEHNNGIWPGGWTWTNYSTTVRVLDSLVARGLVDRREYQTDKKFVTTYEANSRGRSLAQLVGCLNWHKITGTEEK